MTDISTHYSYLYRILQDIVTYYSSHRLYYGINYQFVGDFLVESVLRNISSSCSFIVLSILQYIINYGNAKKDVICCIIK